MSARRTSIAIDRFKSREYKIQTGILQGSLLSPILYLFYNADLIEDCNQEPDTMLTEYIDGVVSTNGRQRDDAEITSGDPMMKKRKLLEGGIAVVEDKDAESLYNLG